jgi:hypothetical protein
MVGDVATGAVDSVLESLRRTPRGHAGRGNDDHDLAPLPTSARRATLKRDGVIVQALAALKRFLLLALRAASELDRVYEPAPLASPRQQNGVRGRLTRLDGFSGSNHFLRRRLHRQLARGHSRLGNGQLLAKGGLVACRETTALTINGVPNVFKAIEFLVHLCQIEKTPLLFAYVHSVRYYSVILAHHLRYLHVQLPRLHEEGTAHKFPHLRVGMIFTEGGYQHVVSWPDIDLYVLPLPRPLLLSLGVLSLLVVLHNGGDDADHDDDHDHEHPQGDQSCNSA